MTIITLDDVRADTAGLIVPSIAAREKLAAKQAELHSAIAEIARLPLWEINAMPAHSREFDGSSHIDDLDDQVPWAMQAADLYPGPGDPKKDPWWVIARALNLTAFHHSLEWGWVAQCKYRHPIHGVVTITSETYSTERELRRIYGDDLDSRVKVVHVWSVDRGTPTEWRLPKKAYPCPNYERVLAEIRRRNAKSHLEMRKFAGFDTLDRDDPRDYSRAYRRAAIEFPDRLSDHHRDGGDFGIASVATPGLTTPFWAVLWERKHLTPAKPRHVRTWELLKYRDGKGPKLTRGAWVASPLEVVPFNTAEDAIDAAWKWAAEVDADDDTVDSLSLDGLLEIAVNKEEAADD